MADHESNESSSEAAQADRRSFMKTAVKTVVAGAAVAGIAGASSTAQAASSCGGSLIAPKAVVKAHVTFNNQAQIKREDVLAIINGLFNGSVCPTCGLNGFPGPRDPGTIIEINIGSGFLPSDQLSNVQFTDAGGGF